MTVKRYDCAIMKLEIQVVLYLDAHMFEQEEFYQVEPDVVVAIMTQISLKDGSKEWVEQANSEKKSKNETTAIQEYINYHALS